MDKIKAESFIIKNQEDHSDPVAGFYYVKYSTVTFCVMFHNGNNLSTSVFFKICFLDDSNKILNERMNCMTYFFVLTMPRFYYHSAL